MTYRALITAGWLCMFSAFVSIPVAYYSFRLDTTTDQAANLIQIVIQTAGVALFVAITMYLKKLLNVQFGFYETNKNIDMMILANVVASVMVIIAYSFTDLKETLSTAALVVAVFQGIIQIQFGFKLMKLQNDLGGMLKPFCVTNIATGICIASVVLIIVGVVVSAVSDLMLGTIFFQLSKLMNQPEQIESNS